MAKRVGLGGPGRTARVGEALAGSAGTGGGAGGGLAGLGGLGDAGGVGQGAPAAIANDDRVVRPAINRKTQVIRTGGARWSQRAERVFLEELAATCNVRAACAKAGFSTTAVYQRRKKWPGFAEEWAECLEQGYARLEMTLVELATDSLRRVAIGAAAAGGDEDGEPAMSIPEAMNLLRLHRAAVKGGPAQRYDSRAKPVDIEQVRSSILRKIEAIERGEARVREREGAGE